CDRRRLTACWVVRARRYFLTAVGSLSSWPGLVRGPANVLASRRHKGQTHTEIRGSTPSAGGSYHASQAFSPPRRGEPAGTSGDERDPQRYRICSSADLSRAVGNAWHREWAIP